MFVAVGAGSPVVALFDTAPCGSMGNDVVVLVLMGSKGLTVPPSAAWPPCCGAYGSESDEPLTFEPGISPGIPELPISVSPSR